ncbi:MAG: hypothetical protein JO130_18565 [Solirubrobacterales bacterium]|nr:hypothetical protein [Solirubrobacterales bacterium]
MSFNSNALSTQWGSFLDLQNDLKPFLNVPSSDTSRDVVLQDLIDGISEWVQLEAGRPLAKTRFEFKFDGNSGWKGSYLMLPYVPVLEVISVTEYWGYSGPHVLTEQTPTSQVDGWQCEYRTGRLTRVFQGLIPKPWFPGSGNVIVEWDAGFNPVPKSVQLATKEAIKWYWDNTQQHSRSRPSGQDEWNRPDPSQFWGSVMPAMMRPLLEQYAQVGMG